MYETKEAWIPELLHGRLPHWSTGSGLELMVDL